MSPQQSTLLRRLGFDLLETRQLMAADTRFLPDGFEVAAVADMDRNGSPDYVLQATKSVNGMPVGQGIVWFMDGNRRVEATLISQPGDPWSDIRIAGAGDFSGDGKPDLVFEQRGSGAKGIWQMDGAHRLQQTWIGRTADSPLNYEIQAVGDFSGDGQPDIALNYKLSGDKTIWVMSRLQRYGAYWVPPPAEHPSAFQIVAAGDFNGNRIADLVVRHSTGRLGIWTMNGPNARNGAVWITGAVDSLNTTKVEGVADINFDGKLDVIVHDPVERDLKGLGMDEYVRFESFWIGRHAVDATWGNGQVTIIGSQGADSIAIHPKGNGVMVIANGTHDYFLKAVSQIIVYAGDGNDFVINQTGIPSELHGEGGNDELDGGALPDLLFGELGNDKLYGRSGSDVLHGGEGNDELYGGALVDFLHGGNGDDLLDGGADTDFLIDVAGSNRVFFGAEGDLVSRASAERTVVRNLFFFPPRISWTNGENFGDTGIGGVSGPGDPGIETTHDHARQLVERKVKPALDALEKQLFPGKKSGLREFQEELASQPIFGPGGP